MQIEPLGRQVGDLLECAGLLEEVRRPRHHRQLVDAAKLSLCPAIELENLGVGAADYQERRGAHGTEPESEVRAASARDHRVHPLAQLGRCRKRSRSAGARTEVRERQLRERALPRGPGARRTHSLWRAPLPG